MSNKTFYQETFSQVRPSGTVRWEDMESMRPAGRPTNMKRIVILAAVICLLAGLSAVAVANDWLGLRNLELNGEVTVIQPDGTETTVTVPTGTISLQGYNDTPEKKALEEWQNFLSTYDDGGLLDRLGNSPSGFEGEYGLYLIYSQEMADKFEEILAKYGLKKHISMLDDLYTKEALCAQVGGDFLGKNRAGSTYMYEDGTFHFDGDVDLGGYGLLDYQFMRCVRGSFTDMMLNIGDVADYREWVYTTASGISVTLALGPAKGLVIADLPDSFVTINVLAGTETPESDVFSSGPFMAEDLERFADSFDFSILTPVRPADPDLPRPSLEEVLGTPSAEEFLLRSGVEEAEAQQFYAAFVGYVENADRQAAAELLVYPAVVTTGEETAIVNSPEEFLPYYDIIFSQSLMDDIWENQYTKERADLLAQDGMAGAAGGCIWFARQEDGRIRIVMIENSEGAGIGPGEVSTAPVEETTFPGTDWTELETYAGVGREEMETFAQTLHELLQTGDAEDFAALLSYPCTLTLNGEETSLKSAEEFLPYYRDTVWWDAKTLAMDVGSLPLFYADGLAGVGDGQIWLGKTADGLRILTVQIAENWSIRPGG